MWPSLHSTPRISSVSWHGHGPAMGASCKVVVRTSSSSSPESTSSLGKLLGCKLILRCLARQGDLVWGVGEGRADPLPGALGPDLGEYHVLPSLPPWLHISPLVALDPWIFQKNRGTGALDGTLLEAFQQKTLQLLRSVWLTTARWGMDIWKVTRHQNHATIVNSEVKRLLANANSAHRIHDACDKALDLPASSAVV